MTDFADFKLRIAEYANREDWSDAVVTGFIRAAEEKLNSELRIDRMICTATNIVTQGCATLPDNWLESDFMLIQAETATGWTPIRYRARDEFFRLAGTPCFGEYTIRGRSIFFSGPVDDVEGTTFQLDYYGEVPVFSDTQDSWVYTKYSSLYLYASLMHADLHAVGEEATAASMKQLTEDMINKLNADHRYARASGSRVARARVRSFG